MLEQAQPHEFQTLDQLASDPRKLAEAGFLSLSTVTDPEVRRNRLYQELLDIAEGANRPDAQDVDRQEAQWAKGVLGRSSGTGMLPRLLSGAFRGVFEGGATPVAAEVLGIPRGLSSGEMPDSQKILDATGRSLTWFLDPAKVKAVGAELYKGADANTIGNLAGNIGGFVAGPGKLVKLASLGKAALGLGAMGAGQAIGSHMMFERDKAGARQEIEGSNRMLPPEAPRQQIPEALKPAGYDSGPAVANIIGQTALSAASGGLSGKLQALMKANKVVPALLKGGAVASPVVEGVGSGALMLNDASNGTWDLPQGALDAALGAPLLMGGAQSAMTAKGMAGYRPSVPQPQGYPTPAHPTVGQAPASLISTPASVQGRTNFPDVDVTEPDAIRAILGQSFADELPKRLNALQELSRGGKVQNPAATFFYSDPQTGQEFRLQGMLDAGDAERQHMPGLGIPRHLVADELGKVSGIQEGLLADRTKGMQLGAQLPSGERFNVPSTEYAPVPGNTAVRFMDPSTGGPVDGVAVLKPTQPDASGEMYWYVAVPNPQTGGFTAKRVHSSILSFPAQRGTPGKGPMRMAPPAPPLPIRGFGVDTQSQEAALMKLLQELELSRTRQNPVNPGQLVLPFNP